MNYSYIDPTMEIEEIYSIDGRIQTPGEISNGWKPFPDPGSSGYARMEDGTMREFFVDSYGNIIWK